MSIYTVFGFCVIPIGIVYIIIGRQLTISKWRQAVIGLSAAFFGLLGCQIVNHIETSIWIGTSFYGVHFFAPLGIILGCLLTKVTTDDTRDMLDFAVPSICAAHVLIKINCHISGCCRGILIETTHSVFRFPIQLVECAFVLFLTVLFIRMIRRGNHRGTIWYLYMVFYGSGRFFLNLLRDDKYKIFGMASGNFWSLISIAIGLNLLYIHHLRIVTAEEKKAATQNRKIHKAH